MKYLYLVFPWIIIIVRVIIAIPFLTLFERKILRYIQIRKGPKKVGFLGLLQPIRDGVKLVLKELGTPSLAKVVIFWISPILSFILMLFVWGVFPFYNTRYTLILGIILFLCISSLQVYTVLGSGWGRNSKYALLGSLRGAAQTISYEVALIIVIFLPCCFQLCYKFSNYYEKYISYFFLFFPIFFVWFISCLAETNRAPFDFAEGERELVSGFKIEYAAMEFACLFLAEYGKIFFMRFIRAILFLPTSFGLIIFVGNLLAFSFVWARGTLPRFRYDFLMKMAWKIFLPLSLSYLFFVFCV